MGANAFEIPNPEQNDFFLIPSPGLSPRKRVKRGTRRLLKKSVTRLDTRAIAAGFHFQQ